jgi:hypothetical protein
VGLPGKLGVAGKTLQSRTVAVIELQGFKQLMELQRKCLRCASAILVEHP